MTACTDGGIPATGMLLGKQWTAAAATRRSISSNRHATAKSPTMKSQAPFNDTKELEVASCVFAAVPF